MCRRARAWGDCWRSSRRSVTTAPTGSTPRGTKGERGRSTISVFGARPGDMSQMTNGIHLQLNLQRRWSAVVICVMTPGLVQENSHANHGSPWFRQYQLAGAVVEHQLPEGSAATPHAVVAAAPPVRRLGEPLVAVDKLDATIGVCTGD